MSTTASENELQTIRYYYRYDATLASAGQPEASQLELLPGAFDCVVNLARPDSPHALTDEAGVLEALGLPYIHLPVDFKHPLARDIDNFLAMMREPTEQRLFVHCAYNWRASSFVFLHRIINTGCDPQQAKADLHAIWQPDATWQAFIETTLQRYELKPE